MSHARYEKYLIVLISILICVPVIYVGINVQKKIVNSNTKTIQVNGVERKYKLHLPPNFESSKKYKLVLALHGASSTADQMEKYSEWNSLADKYSFIVAYPDGLNKGWNDGRVTTAPTGEKFGDDVTFIINLIDLLVKNNEADPTKVFATGISNGGFMSFELACKLPDKIAAVGIFAADVATTYQQDCDSPGLPIIWFNGDSDPIVPFEGGSMRTTVGLKTYDRGEVMSADDSVKFWLHKNQCLNPPEIRDLPDINHSDSSTVELQKYCPSSETPLNFYRIKGGGHTIPERSQYLPQSIIGNVNQDIDGIQLTWEFFETV